MLRQNVEGEATVQVTSENGVQRDARGRLVKGGGSLNKSGMDRKKAMMLRNLEGLTPKAIKTLERLLDDPNPTARFSAAREILDRNLGRVKQSVQVDVTSTHILHLQALEAIAARRRAQLIEAQATEIIEHATLDRIASHDHDVIMLHPGAGLQDDPAAEAPPSPEGRGAAANAPTTPATHENPSSLQDEKP
jgi:hypothetical protein